MVKRVCLVSSGTGGHLMPAMALADALGRAGHESVLLTEGRDVEQAMLQDCPCPQEKLGAFPVGPKGAFRMLGATFAARRFLKKQEVDFLVVAGGSTGVPAGLAASSLRLPLCLLEQNSVTGRANRFLLPFAKRIYMGLPSKQKLRRSLFTGTPLRTELGKMSKSEARARLGLAMNIPVLMVTGGSQGAHALNWAVPRALGQMRRPVQVLHLSGKGEETQVRADYAAVAADGHMVSAMVWPMVADMASLYAAADLVICRGGGSTVAELMAVGRASILVPYPYHKDRQQWHNGEVLQDARAARLIEEVALTPETLADCLRELLQEDTLQQMGSNAAALAPKDACNNILTDLQGIGVLD